MLAFLNHKDTFHQKAVKAHNQIRLAQLSHGSSNATDNGTLVEEARYNETGPGGPSDLTKKDVKNAGSPPDSLDVNGDHSEV